MVGGGSHIHLAKYHFVTLNPASGIQRDNWCHSFAALEDKSFAALEDKSEPF
jgi:hypothetical protein